MRLFQLARKLGTTPDHLVTTLAQHNHVIENKSNTKLTAEHEALLTHLLATEEDTQEPEDAGSQGEVLEIQEVVPEETLTKGDEGPEKEEPSSETTDEPVEAPEESTVEVAEEDEEIEVIRVKKVKLDGPKVVGKIDLPEPTVKTNPEVKESKERSRRKERNLKRKSSRRTPTPEQLRQHEKRVKDRKRKEEEHRKKKNRTKFYQENIQLKPEAAPKAKKKKHMAKRAETSTTKVKVEKHKNPIKRLWAWLNGEYDNF
ncbi:MAG: hypothetical protein AAF693_12315 [Bacteroidota bacterium]